MRTLTVVGRDDHLFEVSDGVEIVAGPFSNPDAALTWISSRNSDGRVGLRAYPDDIIKTAIAVQTSYLQRTAKEDLAQLIAAAIHEERRRCADLAMSMDTNPVEVSKGLMRKPTFKYLADLIKKGAW